MSEPSYDEVPYEGRPVPATAPAAIALTARVHGGPSAPLERARVLELGCGDGANLLPLAFFHPDWQLIGVDSSEHALASAESGARALGLENVRFVRGDVGSFETGEHDFVIAHGIYSWVDAGRRAAMRALIGRALAPSGLAYVSFNAQPAWGVRGRVRDALTRWPAGLEGSRSRARSLIEILGEPANDWALLLTHELSRATDATDAYLAHEYLAKDNEAFWLGDVVRDFAACGLRYAGDATFDRPEGWVAPAVRERVAAIADDPMAREELIDLLAYRQLRASVFARSEAPSPSPSDDAILDDTWIACAARALHDPFDPSPGVEEPFAGPRGTELRVRGALTKMALLILASVYPRGMRLDALIAEANAHLDDHGLRAGPDDVAHLRAGMLVLYRRLELELRLEDAPLHLTPSERPIASALTRYEASERSLLTTPIHSALPLEPIDRAIIARLDGTRRADEVAGELARAIADGTLEVEGAESGEERARAFLEPRVSRTITTLGWWGLAR